MENSSKLDVSFLYPWQSVAIREILEPVNKGKYFMIKSFRQMAGKTFTLLNLLGLIALTKPGSVSILIEPTFGQSQRCLEDITKAYIDWIKVASKGNNIVDFNNGSRIYFKSGEQKDSLRGFTVKNEGILAIDEAVFISNEVFEILLPVVNKKKATVVMTSTPDKMSGMFFDLYTRGLANDPKVKSINWSNYIDKVYTEEELSFYKSIYSERRYQTEILGEFVSSGGSVFQNIYNSLAPSPVSYQGLYFGIDWGTGNGKDYTVITALTDSKQMLFQKAFNDIPPVEQVEYIARLIQEYKPRKVLVEKNSIGSIYYDQLRRICPGIIAFNTTNESKCRIVDQLASHLEKGQIKLLEDEELLTQLKGFEESTTRSGLRTYNCPQPLHDDRVMSLCFALEAIVSSTGIYRLGSANIRR